MRCRTYARGGEPMKIWVYVQKSRIAGQGLFAGQDIRKGTRIIQYTGEKISRQESNRRITAGNPYIFTFNDRWDIDGKDLSNTAHYSNHSCDPNWDILPGMNAGASTYAGPSPIKGSGTAWVLLGSWALSPARPTPIHPRRERRGFSALLVK